MDELIKAVLEWWDEHQCDTTGYRDEWNVYDDEPEFVKIAMKLKEKNADEQ
jgi:hypothetical protein